MIPTDLWLFWRCSHASMNEKFCTRVKQTLSYRLQSTEVGYLVTCRHKPHSKAKTPGGREHVCLLAQTTLIRSHRSIFPILTCNILRHVDPWFKYIRFIHIIFWALINASMSTTFNPPFWMSCASTFFDTLGVYLAIQTSWSCFEYHFYTSVYRCKKSRIPTGMQSMLLWPLFFP